MQKFDATTKPTEVPASAMRLRVGEFELGDNGDDAKTAPFKMVARSGKPINHWFWGKIAHDFGGMQHKSRIPIDYVHDDKEIVGFGNKIRTTNDGDLEVSGALTPFKDSDRATEIVHKAKLGVPYEASINFAGDVKLQYVEPNELTQVNGMDFEGPGVIVRQWSLRGVAVCPYGADANTSTSLSQDTCAVSYVESEDKETEMSEQNKETKQHEPAEAPKAVEAASVLSDKAEAAAVDAGKDRATEGKRFLEAFGDKGGKWFAEGLSFDEAQAKFVESLKEENETLRQRLSAKDSLASPETEPVKFDASDKPHDTRTGLASRIRIAGKQYDKAK